MVRAFTLAALALAAFVVALTGSRLAGALSIDEARAACIAQVRPSVVACVRSHVIAHGGWPRAYLAECREPAIPRVRACVFRTLAANGYPGLASRRALPAVGQICPLGFAGCMSRCFYIGGIGGLQPAKGCGRICAYRCGGRELGSLPAPAIDANRPPAAAGTPGISAAAAAEPADAH